MQTSQQMQAKAIVIPVRYLCPITQQIMIEPVVAADGRTYEREAIAEWLENNNTSPIDREILEHKKLTLNRDKRSDILEYLDEHPELYQSDELYFPQAWIKETVFAIKAQDLNQVEVFLRKDKRLLSMKLENDYTVWHLACEYGSAEIVNLLLKQLSKDKLFQINQHNPATFKPQYIHTLLEEALSQNDTKQAAILLELGTDLEQVDIAQNTLLHRLVIKGQVESVAWLLERKVNLEACNNEGNTPLLLAVLHNHSAIVELLLSLGANPLVTNKADTTTVAVALINNNQSILNLLLDEKLAVLSPLHLALKLHDINLLKFLLAKDQSNIEALDAKGCTVLWSAIDKDNLVAVDLLLAKGANPSASCTEQLTPLHLAVRHNNKTIVERLLQAKPNIDAADSEGNTPLHLAAKLGNNEVIPLLLEAGANPKVRNNAFKIPLKLAIGANKLETVKLIEQTLRKLKLDKLAKLDKLEEIETLRQKISQVEQAQVTAALEKADQLMHITQLESALIAETKARAELCSIYEITRQRIEPLIVKADTKARMKAEAAAKKEIAKREVELAAKQATLKVLPKFLRLVAEGEQDQAEAMLRDKPDLGLLSGDVTDLSKRSFNNITGFQYAVWALDYHMWTMLLKHLKPEDVTEQLKGMETGSWVRTHGKSASWQNLIDALDTYISLCNQSKWDEATTQWNRGVGDAQAMLPVHVVNEYCHPTRSFDPCPNFKDATPLPRSRKTDEGEWFTAEYNGGHLGTGKFAGARGWCGEVVCSGFVGRRVSSDRTLTHLDKPAVATLLQIRVEQRQALFAEYIGNKYQTQFKLK